MLISSLTVNGLPAPSLKDIGSRVDAPDGIAGVALADALDLFAATLRPDRVAPTLARFDFAQPDDIEVISEAGLPVQALWPPSSASRVWCEGESVTVEATLSIDPLLYALFREHALRDPRLVTAMGQESKLTVKAGWLFTPDRSAVALALHGLSVGSTSFHVVGTERPPWIAGVANELGKRFGRVDWAASADTVCARLHAASLSSDPAKRRGFERARLALAEPPFGLGTLELVRAGDGLEARFGPELVPARRFGPAAIGALRLVEAVYVDAPDVLVVEAPGMAQRDPGAVADWLESATDGNEATLEQVVLVPGGGG